MNRLTQWVRRLREFRRGDVREAEMDAEVRLHLEMEEAELIRSGLSPAGGPDGSTTSAAMSWVDFGPPGGLPATRQRSFLPSASGSVRRGRFSAP